MKTVLIAACALAFVGCGPPDSSPAGCALAETEQALDDTPVSMDELPAPLQALIEEVAKNQRIWEQDPVEERFFHVVTVTQTPPQTPRPPCPSCR